ncbi:MAG: DUF4363 family protein [Clostridium sp.]|uniref:DUF4363 family protein n=1 Tax=Clostridium sp. TaxID=1506 RepID=UPI00290E3FA9|nr:DUF4363 family protein [Clostridium sp.]MDU4938819.1 DUF4363 family protein [Clostridium sp.]
MRNTIISVIAFLGLLGFVFYANNSLNELCHDIIESNDEIRVYIESKDWDNAYLTALNVIEEIEESKSIAAVYVNHCEVDNILSEATRLCNYIKSENMTESLVSNEIVEKLAENIIDINVTNIQNIF